jgi:tetratricopeptide (TPR) repeat protein
MRNAEFPAPGKSWKQSLGPPGLLCLLLGLTTLAVYWPAGGNGFVDYDDGDYVTANPHVQSGLTWDTVVWAFTTGHASNWHPLTWLSHALDWRLFGEHAGPQHLVSVALHMANTLLLFLVLRRLTGALWRSVLAAAFFALHPLHVESVAWVSERKDVLSGLFFLLTLGAYTIYAGKLRAKEKQKTENRKQKTEELGALDQGHSEAGPAASVGNGPLIYYLLSLLFFTLGLMSKPMLVTLPFVLVLVDWWPLERLRRPAFGGLVLEKLPFLALSLASSVVTFLAQRKGGALSTVLPLDARIGNALISYVRYLAKMLWPAKLSVLYTHPGHWPLSQVIAAACFLAVATGAVVFLARRRPALAVGWFWFVGMLIPVIGLVQVGIQSMADRYMYLPMIGLLVLLMWDLPDLLPLQPWRVPALGLAAVLALVPCAALTVRQVRYWHDSEALFGHAVKVTDRNYLAYNNLGFYRSRQGRTKEAMENYRRSLEINPNYEDALNNMGYALAGQKKYEEAIGYYLAALRLRPNHPEVHNNLGNAVSELGRIDEAIQHYWVTLAQQPEHADAHNNLGVALAMQGQLDEAIVHFRKAIRFKPNDASEHGNLGNALAVQHKLDEAIHEYEQALRLKPEDAQGHNNLGNALAEQGKLDRAIRQYQEALRLNADNPEAHANLANALAAQGNLPQALEHFQAALGLAPNNPEFHYRFAQVLLHQGRRDEAAAHLTAALQLRPGFSEARKQLELLRAP